MATEDIDYYALLGVEQTATLQEIKSSFRKRSLKVHPDRNPDNPEAARLFHELRVAADLLADPTQRASFDALLNARNARKLRFSALDSKRKAMAHDLEQRERDFKRAKGDQDAAARERQTQLDRLKDQSRQLREQREKLVQEQTADELMSRREMEQARRDDEHRRENVRRGIVELGPLDKTLKVKWLKAVHPRLTSTDAISEYLERLLHPSKPDIESIVVSSKTLQNPSKGKYGTGVIAFKSLSAAVRVVKGKRRAADANADQDAWNGFEVDWASGAPPAALRDEAGVEFLSSSKTTKSSRPPSPVPTVPTSSSSFPAASFLASDESTILAQLREREREKLIEQMRRQDEEDERNLGP